MPEGPATRHFYWGVKCPKCARFFALQAVTAPDAEGNMPEMAQQHLSRRIMCDRCGIVFLTERKRILLYGADVPLTLYRD